MTGLGVELARHRVLGTQLHGLGQRLDGLLGLALAQEGLAPEEVHEHGVAGELTDDAHLIEHLVVAAQRQERGAEEQASVDERGLVEEPRATDLYDLGEVSLLQEQLAPLNEVLRHPGRL